jgi:copper chaperone CopZ
VKKITLGLFLAATLALASCGKQSEPQAQKVADNAKAEKPAMALNVSDPNVMKISVPTMQCESCAKTIKKGVKTVPEAQDVDVDVDTKTVFVKVANNTPETQHKIEEAISKVGYSTTSVQRDPAAYNDLPECCQDGGAAKEKSKKM